MYRRCMVGINNLKEEFRRKEMKKLWIFLIAVGLCLTMGLATVSAQPIALAGRGIGDMGVGSLYDVRPSTENRPLDRTNGWQNFLVVENTSPLWTAFHLRFRSWRKSIEVYDHVILLSPYDVFWAVIEVAETAGVTNEMTQQNYVAGDVLIWSQDEETCENSGLIYPDNNAAVVQAWRTKFQDFLLADCGYSAPAYDLQEEMYAGHWEAIGLFQLTDVWPMPAVPAEDTHNIANIVNGNLHDDGVLGNPNVYDVLDALFYDFCTLAAVAADWPKPAQAAEDVVIIGPLGAGAGVTELGNDVTPRWGADCGNVLAGALHMVDGANGRQENYNLVFFTDFRTENWAAAVPPAGPTPLVANLHRDSYNYGAMVFPTCTMDWEPWTAPPLPGEASYLNENWATTVGPGMRDGDDNNELVAATHISWANQGACIDSFNDIWSLDDVEDAAAVANSWHHYFNGPWGQDYVTDVNLTFFTKHYHYFFCTEAVAGCVNWPWYDMLGYAAVNLYWDDIDNYRGAAAEGTGMSIEERFDFAYNNGPITCGSTVFDMDQNACGQPPDAPPPGSPWRPQWDPPVDIPHEVNLIRVGAVYNAADTSITGGNGTLALDPTLCPQAQFDMGQWNIAQTALEAPLTGTNRCWTGGVHPVYDSAGCALDYRLPPLGMSIFLLNYGNGTIRSSALPVHQD